MQCRIKLRMTYQKIKLDWIIMRNSERDNVPIDQ